MRKILLLIAIIFPAVFLSGCDPGVSFVPDGWQRAGNQFHKNYEGFDIKMEQIGGLIGQKRIIFEGVIYNRGNRVDTFQIQKAVLRTKNNEYIGEQNLANNKIEKIKPGDKQHFSVYFVLKDYLDKELKDPVELDVVVRSGNQTNEIVIPMTDHWPPESNNDIKRNN